jgi:hypothetical protein
MDIWLKLMMVGERGVGRGRNAKHYLLLYLIGAIVFGPLGD